MTAWMLSSSLHGSIHSKPQKYLHFRVLYRHLPHRDMGNVMMMSGTSLNYHHDICASLHGTSRRL
ncbi:hypothetical protein EKG38_07025 [Shewanella canadensis]|uniref:Uncharacterized protein n=1 Tax=Shewanella canadensis TaxID=271096 RepID=A0A3S0KX11_9GAMM|nr:hypothetical protein EKG38_07025 [Shewanella canadensis]